MKSLYKKIDLEHILFALISTLLLFGTDFLPEYATDSYFTFTTDELWKHMLYDNGRVIGAIIYYFFENIFAVTDKAVYLISYLSGILFLSISIYIVSSRLRLYCHNKYISVAISTLLCANLFSVEYFLFLETGIFMLAFLITVLAFLNTIYYFEEQKNKYLIRTLILLILAVNMYQIFLAAYVILCLPYIIKYSKTCLMFVKYNLIVVLMYTFSMGTGVIVTKVFLSSSRLNHNEFKFTQIIDVLHHIKAICLVANNVIPKYLFAGAVLVIFILCLGLILYSKRYIQVAQILYISMMITGLSFAPHYLGITDDYSTRIIYPFAMIIGVLLCHMYVNMNLETAPQRWRTAAYLFIFMYFGLQLVAFNIIFVNRYKCNQTDKYLCEMIYDRIEQYEQNNNLKVTNICFYQDKNPSAVYEDMSYVAFTPRAFDYSWSDLYSLIYFSGRPFSRGVKCDEYEKYFYNRDWNIYSDEQLVFDGDTLHLCVY